MQIGKQKRNLFSRFLQSSFGFILLSLEGAHGGHHDLEHMLHEIEEKRKQKKKIIRGASWSHNVAYMEAAKEVGLVNDDGEPEYDKLNDSDFSRKFAEALTKKYVEIAKKRFGAKPKTKLDEQLLMKAYTGMNDAEISGRLAKHGAEYTHELHTSYAAKFKESLENELDSAIYAGITHEHIPGIVKKVGLEKHVDAAKMHREDAIAFLEQYFRNKGPLGEGVIPEHMPYKKKSHAVSGHGGGHG